MATQKQTAAQRGRNVQQKKQQRNLILIGVVTLLILVVIGGLAAIGRQSTETAQTAVNEPVQVVAHGAPADAEPNGRAWGPVDAPITVVEYADYECESCGYFARNYEQVFTETFASSGKVRFEIRNTPFHGENSRRASEAAYCAAEQNNFWPYHDSLFLNQPAHGQQGFSAATLDAIAGKLGMDTGAFGTCLGSGKYTKQVDDDYNTAVANGVTGTPTFVVNGKPYVGPKSTAEFRQIFTEAAPNVTFE